MSEAADYVRDRIERAIQKRVRKILRRTGVEVVPRPDDRCPRCNGAGVVETKLPAGATTTEPIDLCLACGALWEREVRPEPELEHCDNCAFRPGSPEQQDPERWATIVEETVRGNGMFLCHKRVPMTIRGPEHVEGAGLEYQFREQGQIRYGSRCHGWAKARCTQLVKETKSDGEEGSEEAHRGTDNASTEAADAGAAPPADGEAAQGGAGGGQPARDNGAGARDEPLHGDAAT